MAVDPKLYPNLTAVRIPLTPEDVNLFYETFSKEALWPVIFSFLDKAKFNQKHWEHYLEINRIFAERTAAVAEPGALVWVHDYNLWMVPHFLRRLRPDVKIAFFHHTSFPASDIFNIIPWRREIIDSLLDCDYVGFHIPHYVENFVDAIRTHAPMDILERVPTTPRFRSFGCALGVDEMVREIKVGDRRVRMGAHPVGINVKAIESILERPEHAAMQRLVGDLNRLYREEPALHRRDADPGGFSWIVGDDAANSVFVYLREGFEGDAPVVVALNLTPQPHAGYRAGLPRAGRWRELLNTDAAIYGGSNRGNEGAIEATAAPLHGRPASAALVLPPLAAVLLRFEGAGP